MANVNAKIDRHGRDAAVLVYGLYLLSIPSLALFAPAGVIVAYLNRDAAGGLAHAHLNRQIRLFWIAFAIGAGLALASIPAWVLTIVLIGFPLLWLIGLAGFVVMLWFTLSSFVGLLRLLAGEDPA